MKRREFVTGLVVITSLPRLTRAQTSKPAMPKIGVLWADGTPEGSLPSFGNILIEALGGLGYVDGKTVHLIQRFPAAQSDIRGLAQDLIDNKVDVIVATSVVGANETQQLTSSVPIVVVFASDLVKLGLVDSLAHPGRNITGLTLISDDLRAKRLSLLREVLPKLSRVTLLFDPKTPFHQIAVDAQSNAARAVGLTLRSVATPTADAIEQAFADVGSNGSEGVTFSAQPMMTRESARIGAASLAHRVPAIGYFPGMARDGLLMAYGQDFDEYARKAAGYADKILKGAKPADLPVEQPTVLKLAINLKTANALGLTFPPVLLTQADEVIE
jgi:putative ABC transport system substrate-binding protein